MPRQRPKAAGQGMAAAASSSNPNQPTSVLYMLQPLGSYARLRIVPRSRLSCTQSSARGRAAPAQPHDTRVRSTNRQTNKGTSQTAYSTHHASLHHVRLQPSPRTTQPTWRPCTRLAPCPPGTHGTWVLTCWVPDRSKPTRRPAFTLPAQVQVPLGCWGTRRCLVHLSHMHLLPSAHGALASTSGPLPAPQPQSPAGPPPHVVPTVSCCVNVFQLLLQYLVADVLQLLEDFPWRAVHGLSYHGLLLGGQLQGGRGETGQWRCGLCISRFAQGRVGLWPPRPWFWNGRQLGKGGRR